MIIRKMRASFGKLHGELKLQEGMNLLCLPNEAGKSTWSAFLVAMLYGIDTSERASSYNQGLPMKERYKPWDGSAMEGAIELSWNGREITIERTTDRRVPMGAFRAYETASGVPVPELTGDNCGRVLCGVERSVFERTAFIRQLGLTVTEDAALEKRLGALVTTGEDGAMSYSELADELKKQRNRLTGKAGRLPRLTEQSAAVQKTLDDLYAMQDDALRITAQKEAAQAEVARLEALEARYQRAQQAKKRAGLSELEQKTAAQEALCRELKESSARLPEEEELRTLHRSVQTAEDALRTAKLEAAFASTEVAKPAVLPAFAGLTAQEARQKASDDRAEYDHLRAVPPRKRWSLVLCIAVMLAGLGLCAVGIALEASAGLLIAGLAVFAAGLIGLGVYLFLRGKRASAVRARLRQADLIPLRYGLTDCETLAQLAEDYASTLSQYEKDCAAAAAQKQSLDDAVSAAQRELDGLAARCAAFAPDCTSSADLREAIGAALHTRARLATEQRALETMKQQISSMRVILGDEQLEEDAEALALDGAKLAFDLRQARQRLSDLTTALAAKQGAIGATGSAVELEAEAEVLKEQIRAAQENAAAVDLAAAALKRADETLRSRFSPQITADAGKLLAKLTDGKYPNVLLEPGMLLSVRSEDGTVMRPAAAMSCGTGDQMYLALRLAMCERLLPQDAPLVLDDALVNFDDDRARAAIGLLTELAKKRQVILFSCRRFGE
ncbi:MAG: AAA family ATPase [Oscillospiraceae bacterium]|nr:AAA family ATPase [Oscillospiraceae bacterium]